MRHFTHLRDLTFHEIGSIMHQVEAWKAHPPDDIFSNKILAMVFFNPSLRTRLSFETAMLRHGGHAIALEVGTGSWNLETEPGVTMNGNKPEHVREAVPVISRLADLIGVRSFSSGLSEIDDERDSVIQAFKSFSSVPVISMESAREHPCQGLADMLTIREHINSPRPKVSLVWAPHIKPLPRAVPNSFLLSCAAMGYNITIANPMGYDLSHSVIQEAQNLAKQTGSDIQFSHDLDSAVKDTQVIYTKAWGPSSSSAPSMNSLMSWVTHERHLELADPRVIFMHCLPVRRNLEVDDSVLDSPQCKVIDEAENRFHIQRALIHFLLSHS